MKIMDIIKILAGLFLIQTAYADVMNLNEFMPTRMEDSKVIQERGLEFQVSSNFKKQDTDEIIFRENVRYGAKKNLQLEMIANQLTGGSEKGSGEIQLGGQYDVIPQLGISPMIMLPTGKSEDGVDTHLRFNNSTTFIGSPNTPYLQLHINFDWAHNSQNAPDERANHNLYVTGISYKFNDSGSVLLDVIREEEQEEGVESNMLELGTQYDIGSHYLLGLGGGIGFGDESPHWNGILSLVKQVGM
jgi:hypothetical protein